MGDTLEYDADEAAQEASIYETDAAAQRRERVRALLDPDAGAAVLSIGCGPGFELAELGDSVGESGSVLGVDRSPTMLALAAERCADRSQVALARGDAVSVPVPDDTIDAATAVQVYEYIDEFTHALRELARVLRPGGRAVVCDADFDSVVWRSPDPDRMARVLDAFDDHCPHPNLGSRLAPELRAAGLSVERVQPNTMVNTGLDDTFAGQLAEAVADYVADHAAVGRAAADAWLADLRELEADGGTFFSYTQYCYLVEKPA